MAPVPKPPPPKLTYDDLGQDIAINILKFVPLDNVTRLKQVNRKFADDVKKAVRALKVFGENTFSANILRRPDFEAILERSIISRDHGELIKFDFALIDRWRENKIPMLYALASSAPKIEDLGWITYMHPDFNTFEQSLTYCKLIRDSTGDFPVKRVGLRMMGGTRCQVAELQMNRLIVTSCPNLEQIKVVLAKCRTLSYISLLRLMMTAVKTLPNLKRITLITELASARREIKKLVRKKVEDPEVKIKLDRVIKYKLTWDDEKDAFDRMFQLRYTTTKRPLKHYF